MPMTVACPGCSMSLAVPDEMAGTRVACPGCATELDLPHRRPAAAPRPAAPPPPPPPPPPEAPSWYVASGGATPYGPYTSDQIRAMLAAGQVLPETPLWTNGAPAWAAAASYPQFAAPPPRPPAAEEPEGDDEGAEDEGGDQGGPDLGNAVRVGKFMARRIPMKRRKARPAAGFRRRIGSGFASPFAESDPEPLPPAALPPGPADSAAPADAIDLSTSAGPNDSITDVFMSPNDSADSMNPLNALAAGAERRSSTKAAHLAALHAEETDEVISAAQAPVAEPSGSAPAVAEAPAPAPAPQQPAIPAQSPGAPTGGFAIRYAGGNFDIPPGAEGWLVYKIDALAYAHRRPPTNDEAFRTTYREITGAQVQPVEGGSVLSVAFKADGQVKVAHFAAAADGPTLETLYNLIAERAGPGRLNRLAAVCSNPAPLGIRETVLLLDGLKDEDPQVRAAVAARLAMAGPNEAAIVPALVNELKKKGEFHVLQAVAVALGNIGPAAVKATSSLVETLALLAQARKGKSKAGGRALRFIVTPYGMTNEQALREAAAAVRDALGKIGPAAAKAIPALVQELESEDEEARLGGALALAKISPETRGPGASLVTGTQTLNYLGGSFTDIAGGTSGVLTLGTDGLMFAPAMGAASAKATFRIPYASIIRAVVARGEECGEDVRRIITAVNPALMNNRILLLGFRRGTGIGFAAFRRPSTGRDLEIVLSKLKAVQATATPGPVGGLVRQLLSEKPDAVAAAAASIAAMGPEGRAAIPALSEALRFADKSLRKALYTALGAVCREAQAVAAASVVGIERQKMRSAAYKHAVACLERVRPIVKAGYLTLAEGLGDGDPGVRDAALAAIYDIANTAGQPIATGLAELTTPTRPRGASKAIAPVPLPGAQAPAAGAAG